MADDSENTPFLTDNDHEDDVNNFHREEYEAVASKIPANSHFKRSIKALTIVLAVFSALTVMMAIASFVLIQIAPFKGYTYNARDVLKDLGICTFIAFILSVVMIFLQIPVLISLIIDITFPILILIFSGNVFSNGWPDTQWCFDYYREPRIADPQCIRMRDIVRVTAGITAGLGFVAGILFLVILLLRVIAISRTKFWKRGWVGCPTGQYTFSVTLGVMKQPATDLDAPKTATPPGNVLNREEGRLIDA